MGWVKETVYTRAKFTSLRKSMRNEWEDGVCLLFFVWSIGVPVRNRNPADFVCLVIYKCQREEFFLFSSWMSFSVNCLSVFRPMSHNGQSVCMSVCSTCVLVCVFECHLLILIFLVILLICHFFLISFIVFIILLVIFIMDVLGFGVYIVGLAVGFTRSPLLDVVYLLRCTKGVILIFFFVFLLVIFIFNSYRVAVLLWIAYLFLVREKRTIVRIVRKGKTGAHASFSSPDGLSPLICVKTSASRYFRFYCLPSSDTSYWSYFTFSSQ